MAGIQILLVEGKAVQGSLAKFLLEEAGNTVRTTQSADLALDTLQTFVPDLILVDLHLSGMDGVELIRQLRLGGHGRTPIVALTGYSDPAHLASAREVGCNGIIFKPIDTAAFEAQVRNYVAGNPAADVDAGPDTSDLLVEVRNSFLAEGLEECGTILDRLKSNPDRAMQVAPGILQHWAEEAATLGFPQICNHARRVKALLVSASMECDGLERAIETARHRFYAAARYEPELPLELITGLSGVRVGLVNFSAQEANRVRKAAKGASVKLVLEQLQSETIEEQAGYNVLVINECGFSSEGSQRPREWSLPAIFIGARTSLQSLSKLPARAYDFVIAPWDAEEVLLRLFRLIGKTTPSQPAGDSRIQQRRPRVLIADDDPDLVSLVSATLGQSGMDCEIARSGQQALNTVRTRRPDAIVLDVNMPDLDGFEILKKLRQNLSTKTIPVLMLTARNQGSDIALGFGSGADDYVIKPFDPSDLAKRVATMISASRRPALRR